MQEAAQSNSSVDQLAELLNLQQQAFALERFPSRAKRVEWLTILKKQILKYEEELVAAMSTDFGHRAKYDSLFCDLLPVVSNINYTIAKLKKWMKPSRRSAGLLLTPAAIKVEYQPLGVVGIVVPWNFPLILSLSPLTTAIAAGNRVMLKMSEYTPATNKVVATLLGEVFDRDHICVVQGEADVAAQFSALPFDHLLFTGSTQVGKHVMRAAADNLTPVTLELGGKSPAIITPDADINQAVERLIYGKCLNAGQICVAPDYVLLPKGTEDRFIAAYKQKFSQLYPDFANNPDYTNIVNKPQLERIQALLKDALDKGARIIPSVATPFSAQERKVATQLLLDVQDNMQVMQQEIFGPLLPIISYDSIEQAITIVNNKARPLALYIFGYNDPLNQKIIRQTHSGGVAINDTILHVVAEDAPFGGIGPSGMGHYHGHEGFLTFSKAKTVFKQHKLATSWLIKPPYDSKLQRLLLSIFMR